VLGFPGVEVGDLGSLLLVEEQGSCANEGNEDCKLLSVHDRFLI
jgi:hypothetical protein